MAIKRKGTVARPGVHKNVITGKDEVITWEELKEAVQFQNRIPLVLSHPITGYINPLIFSIIIVIDISRPQCPWLPSTHFALLFYISKIQFF